MIAAKLNKWQVGDKAYYFSGGIECNMICTEADYSEPIHVTFETFNVLESIKIELHGNSSEFKNLRPRGESTIKRHREYQP